MVEITSKRNLVWKAYLETLNEQPDCESKKDKILAKITKPAVQKNPVEEIKIETTPKNELPKEKQTSSKFARVIGSIGRSLSRSSICEDPYQIDPFHDQPELSMLSRAIGNISRSMSRTSIFSNGSDSEDAKESSEPMIMRLLGTIQRSLSRTSIGYEKDIYAATEIDEMEEMKHKMEEEAREIHEERIKIREIEKKLKEKEKDRRKKIIKLNKMEVKVKKSKLKNTVVDRMKFFKIMRLVFRLTFRTRSLIGRQAFSFDLIR